MVLPPATINRRLAAGRRQRRQGATATSRWAPTPARAWTAAIAGSSTSQRLAAAPVVGGGKLFVVDTEGVVHAFDAATGARRWTHSFEVEGDARSSVFGGGVSYDDGTVYVTTGIGDVAALDAATGDAAVEGASPPARCAARRRSRSTRST